MEWFIQVFPLYAFLLGLIIGSFLNVVICRYNTGRSIARGRSCCFSCGKTLRWYELLPIASYLFQKGRCRSCKSLLSFQYVAVELLTGFLFAAVAVRLGAPFIIPDLVELGFWWIVTALLVVITVYDLRHTIIPDGFSLFLASLGLLAFYARGAYLPDLYFAIGVSLFFASLWYFSGGRAMGLGDAKLVFGVTLLLPLLLAISAVLASFYFGAIIGVLLILLKRKKVTFKTEIPFAPFLALGFFAVFLLDISFIVTF